MGVYPLGFEVFASLPSPKVGEGVNSVGFLGEGELLGL